jgi:hypothetical protein
MKVMRNILGAYWFIHLLVVLGLAALFGNIMGNKFLILFVALSFAGAMCGSFIRIMDAINKIDDKRK